jgi:protein subunit release factor A
VSERLFIEIRAAEGGDDAKDLVREQAAVYAAYCTLQQLRCEIVSSRPQAMTLEVAGDTVGMHEIEWKATRGSGAGGQARNKTSNAVQMKHVPTGLSVRVESERSQTQNRATAFALLTARVAQERDERRVSAQAKDRRRQVGSGMRGDKVRTIRLQDGIVVDHQTGRKMPAARYLRGELDELVA